MMQGCRCTSEVDQDQFASVNTGGLKHGSQTVNERAGIDSLANKENCGYQDDQHLSPAAMEELFYVSNRLGNHLSITLEDLDWLYPPSSG